MHNAQVVAANLCWLSKKRSRNPELKAFGEWLEGLRGAASREQISIKLRAMGVPLGGSTIAQYEKGTVWAPDPGVLWGLARIYGQELERMIELLKTNRDHPEIDVSDLLRHSRMGQQDPRQIGGSGVPASDAVTTRVQQQVADRPGAGGDDSRQAAEEIFQIASRLTSLATTLVEARTSQRKKTGRARRHRKAG